MMKPSRRVFAAAAVTSAAAGYQRILGANDRIRLGFIGVGNRGNNLLNATKEYADQQIVAVCDLRSDYLDKAIADAGTNPARFTDYRRLVESDLDAVVVATPDHWHAKMLIDACREGKDVYVEKPLSLTVREGRRMVEVATETKRVVQVGIHRRSSPFCREAAEIVRSGEIGHVTAVRCANVENQWPRGIGNPPDSAPPADLDWDMYLGPAPLSAYNPNRHAFRYRWFYDFGGGQLTDNGVHFLDLIQWGLGHDAAESVTAIGGKFALEDNRETPDTMQTLWQFPGQTLVSFTQYSANAAPISNTRPFLAEFRGTKATMYVFFDGWEIIPESNPTFDRPAVSPLDRNRSRQYRESFRPAMEARGATGSADPRFHIRNFLDCNKTRAKPNCDIESAHRSTTTANIGNIALKTKRHLQWDGTTEKFIDDARADEYLGYKYRQPWTL